MNKELGEILKALNQMAVKKGDCLRFKWGLHNNFRCDAVGCRNCPCVQDNDPTIYITQVIVTSEVLNE